MNRIERSAGRRCGSPGRVGGMNGGGGIAVDCWRVVAELMGKNRGIGLGDQL